MYFFRGAIPVAAFAAPCHPWGFVNSIHGIQNSEKIHFSYGLFLTSSYLNLVVYFNFCWRGGMGRLCRRWLFERFAPKAAFVFFLSQRLVFCWLFLFFIDFCGIGRPLHIELWTFGLGCSIWLLP